MSDKILYKTTPNRKTDPTMETLTKNTISSETYGNSANSLQNGIYPNHFPQKYNLLTNSQIKPQNTPFQPDNLYNTQFFENLVKDLITALYPKACPSGCKAPLAPIKNRRDVLRCSKCHKQISTYAYTPLHRFKLPYWYFGLALYETLIQYPKVITAKELKKRLNINLKSANLLKKRIQLLANDLNPQIKAAVFQKYQAQFKDYQLTKTTGKGESSGDVIVLYSASQRANKGRKRTKYSGTSSIYLSDSLGGKQIGSLVHTTAFKNGCVFYDVLKDQTTESILPLVQSTVPKNLPFYTDEGYPFLYRLYPNHRSVNHSKKGKSGRFAKDRWCQNGVHNQLAEGRNSVLKTAFRNYRYIKPEFAPLYLEEFSFVTNVNALGWDILFNSENGSIPICNLNDYEKGKAVLSEVTRK